MGYVVTFSVAVIGFVTLVFLVERVIGWLARLAEPFLPDDLCGPEGWLVDTARGTGVFDQTRTTP